MNERIILVTGGANGIGKAICQAFASQQDIVLIVDQDEENGLKLENEIRKNSPNSKFLKCDLRKTDEIDQLYQWIKAQYHKIDVLINNAGISKFKSLYDIIIEEFDDIINVNLRATFYMSQQFAKLNKGTPYGRIINIASTRYLMSEPNSEAYAASKGGIMSLTHALALSLSDESITVNCISPGWIQNQDYDKLTKEDHLQHPSKRVGKPEDIANLCLFLSKPENDFINGENIVIDGGMTKKMIYVD